MSDVGDQPKGWQYEGKGTKVSVYMEVEVHAAVQSLAGSLQRSVSWVVNRALRKELGLLDNETVRRNT